jgi:Tfp pilus assembly protein FimV
MAAVTVDPYYVRIAPSRPSAAVYARRRLVAGLLLVLVLAAACLAAGRATAALGDEPASVPGRRPVPAASSATVGTYVVEQGDTLWSIARSLQPEGDVRPLVQALRRANGGTRLIVGTRLTVP